MHRGEMYYITMTGMERGSEMKAEYARAGIIVSNDRCNQYSPVVEIVWLTTREKKPLPTHVKISSARYPSTALCEQIHSVSRERIVGYIGEATEDEMREIDRALAVSIGLTRGRDNVQTKYHMPPDVRRHAIEIVRGYPRRLSAYREARHAILNGSSCPYVEYAYTVRQPNGKIKAERARQYFPRGSSVGDPTAAKALRLAALEDYIETKRMRAVEQALVCVGDDIIDDQVRDALRRAILDSCVDGRNFQYRYRNVPLGKSAFYERRAKFLHDIAWRTNFL